MFFSTIFKLKKMATNEKVGHKLLHRQIEETALETQEAKPFSL